MKKKLLLSMGLLIVMTYGHIAVCNAQNVKKFYRWELVEQVDEFNDSTGDTVLHCMIDGTFKSPNLAGANEVDVSIMFIPDFGFVIQFYEYGKYYASLYTGRNATLSVKTQSGEVSSFLMVPRSKGRIFPCSDASTEKYTEFTRFIELLKSEVSLKCFFIDCKQRSYSFTIDCRGFTKAYNEFLNSNNINDITIFKKTYLYDHFGD